MLICFVVIALFAVFCTIFGVFLYCKFMIQIWRNDNSKRDHYFYTIQKWIVTLLWVNEENASIFLINSKQSKLFWYLTFKNSSPCEIQREFLKPSSLTLFWAMNSCRLDIIETITILKGPGPPLRLIEEQTLIWP